MPQDLLTKPQRNFLTSAKEVAIQMGKNGRALTGVIGELSACEKLGLKWEPTDGHDARKGRKTYQIKTRKNWTCANKAKGWWKEHKADPNGRMGRFEGKQKYKFSVGIYVELDDDFEVWGIWKCKKSLLKQRESAPNLKGKIGLKLKEVKDLGDQVYPSP